ncbi:glycosyltransferase family 2 protein, partial [Campylobacter jejuni]|nr:glycosyltransferase family 2 protein [Campylobacter jejuni]
RFWLTFVKDYFFRGGIKYGYKGFIIALLNANGAFFRYMKLYELNHEKN